MTVAHKYHWHHAPPRYPDGDTLLWCDWCGFRQVVKTRLAAQAERARTGSSAEAPFVIENGQPHEAIRALIDRFNVTFITRKSRNIVESLYKLAQETEDLGKMIAEAGGHEAGKDQNALTVAKIQEARKSAEQVWEIRSEVSE